MVTRIQQVLAREVLDSRGRPTVEVEVHAAGGAIGRATVPSGASTGAAEAKELRDGDPQRYDGLGVLKAVRHVQQIIAPALRGADAADQRRLDARLLELDGTPDKSRLGANAVLGVSMAAAHAAAAAQHIALWRHLGQLLPADDRRAAALPMPMTNLISGGLHAGGNLDFQDFLVVPHAATEYPVALEWIVRIYRRLGRLLADEGYEGHLVGDEGGFGPRLESNEQAARLAVAAIEAAGLKPGHDAWLAVDVASSHFYRQGAYQLHATGGRRYSAAEMIDWLQSLVERYPIRLVEDGLAEEDWTGWTELTRRLGRRVVLIGDDLFATNLARLRRGIELGAANGILIKMNQVGTLSETLDAILLARQAGYTPVVSARSGETEDTTMCDLAVATAAPYIKIGSIVRGERLCKYNRLLRIAEELSRQ